MKFVVGPDDEFPQSLPAPRPPAFKVALERPLDEWLEVCGGDPEMRYQMRTLGRYVAAAYGASHQGAFPPTCLGALGRRVNLYGPEDRDVIEEGIALLRYNNCVVAARHTS